MDPDGPAAHAALQLRRWADDLLPAYEHKVDDRECLGGQAKAYTGPDEAREWSTVWQALADDPQVPTSDPAVLHALVTHIVLAYAELQYYLHGLDNRPDRRGSTRAIDPTGADSEAALQLRRWADELIDDYAYKIDNPSTLGQTMAFASTDETRQWLLIWQALADDPQVPTEDPDILHALVTHALMAYVEVGYEHFLANM